MIGRAFAGLPIDQASAIPLPLAWSRCCCSNWILCCGDMGTEIEVGEAEGSLSLYTASMTLKSRTRKKSHSAVRRTEYKRPFEGEWITPHREQKAVCLQQGEPIRKRR